MDSNSFSVVSSFQASVDIFSSPELSSTQQEQTAMQKYSFSNLKTNHETHRDGGFGLGEGKGLLVFFRSNCSFPHGEQRALKI